MLISKKMNPRLNFPRQVIFCLSEYSAYSVGFGYCGVLHSLVIFDYSSDSDWGIDAYVNPVCLVLELAR